jgi:hypothetical protein
MTSMPRALLVTFAVVSLVTVAFAAICVLPSSGLRPPRTGIVELDEPTPSAP